MPGSEPRRITDIPYGTTDGHSVHHPAPTLGTPYRDGMLQLAAGTTVTLIVSKGHLAL